MNLSPLRERTKGTVVTRFYIIKICIHLDANLYLLLLKKKNKI